MFLPRLLQLRCPETEKFPLPPHELSRLNALGRYQVLDTPAEPAYNPTRAALPPIRGDISFEHVGFRYRIDGPQVLHDVSLTIPAGQVVGIVGHFRVR